MQRFLIENQCYHVVTSTRNRLPLFRETASAKAVATALQFLRAERAYLIAYAVMPDHLHAVLVPRAPYNISRVMQSVKGYTARLLNERNGSRGPLWQRGFYDRMIRDEEQLLDTVNYVHMNPVAGGLAPDPEAYSYSSAGRDDEVDLALFV